MTTQPAPPAKISPLFLGLAVITLGLSSWGLFHLFVDFADAPWWFAASVIGGLDLAAVAFGKHALTVSADGDSPALWNLLLLLFTAMAARAQYIHAMLASWPQIIGVTMAAFPVATVLLFEGQLRRVARVDGRANGTAAGPRRRVPLLVWIRFPGEAWRASSDAIRAQGHLEDTRPEPAAVVPRVRPERTIEPAPAPGAPARSGHDRPQSVAASTRAAVDRVGRDIDAVLAEVRRTTHPDVPRDTVRKNLSRLETNGHVHA